jgi:tetratricopeptide (TPR) repeat protein
LLLLVSLYLWWYIFANSLKKALERYHEGHFHDAIDLWSKALRLNAHDPEVYACRAMAHLKLELYHEAVRDCSDALQLQPPAPAKVLARRAYARKVKERSYQISSSFVAFVLFPVRVPVTLMNCLVCGHFSAAVSLWYSALGFSARPFRTSRPP